MTMGLNQIITCDACGQDLTTTTNSEAYRLALVNQSIPSKGHNLTLVHRFPHLDQDKYFCGIKCLKDWFEMSAP